MVLRLWRMPAMDLSNSSANYWKFRRLLPSRHFSGLVVTLSMWLRSLERGDSRLTCTEISPSCHEDMLDWDQYDINTRGTMLTTLTSGAHSILLVA
mmetsp:Transcript_13576/g.22408  ORF Transcript_13576/g.22408 Transcript_13576/m.22408 type:complete len:96 (+) Transcript_13576:1227-1514(+)